MKACIIGISIICCVACRAIPGEVDETLQMAGRNKGELKKVLVHYGWRDRDSLKFRAACFLIGNMRWHFSRDRVGGMDSRMDVFCRQADSAFYAIWEEKGGILDSLAKCGKELKKRYKWLADSIRKVPFVEPKVQLGMVPDWEAVSSKFLIGHIDNAFYQWETSPFLKGMPFGEFCETVLPYRGIRNYSHLYPGHRLQEWFGKYVNYDTAADLLSRIVRYNRRIGEVRNFMGQKLMDRTGIYGLFFHGQECAEIANYGCTILRACGIPVQIEFCDAYREFSGRHYYCITPDSCGVWQTFNPESSLPGQGKWVMGEPMNIYRLYYGAQPDSPYFLRSEEEVLPPLFASPCIREVTSERAEVFEVRLPFGEKTPNRLAYLAAFQNRRDLAPVTWGTIDSIRCEAAFANVMPDRLYFPVFYAGKELKTFGDPFWLQKDSLSTLGYRLHYFHSDTADCRPVVLTRKFPRKPNMVEVAEKLVGATFCGANQWDFSDSRLLYTITEPPGPFLQDFVVSRPQAYRYYRFKAPEEYPHANVSWLEFLADTAWGYPNVLPATPPAVLSPEQKKEGGSVSRWVKLLDAPSWDKMKWKAEFDGNMQTAPSAYPTVFLRLKEPQVVSRFRFAPKNADNGIRRGDEYELFCWNDGWQSCGLTVARYEYLEFPRVPQGALLWLRNYSSGKEELPFVLSDGEQKFLYHDIVK